ncbi:MAG: hypothetical protein JST89_13710 [Cyanobacteria bacterium SZAS-4]|nr:hypothetical protein [Cyanobacteria bacterium SZAS-4]
MIIANPENPSSHTLLQQQARAIFSQPILYLISNKEKSYRKVRAIGVGGIRSIVRYLNGKSRVELGNNSRVICDTNLRYEYLHEYRFSVSLLAKRVCSGYKVHLS